MPLFRKLATLAAAAEAARRYAKKNPDKAGRLVDQAAGLVDKQTKGKYRTHISGAAQKAKSVAGIDHTPGAGSAANGYVSGHSYPPPSPTPPTPTPPSPTPPSPTPPSPTPSGMTQPGMTQPGMPGTTPPGTTQPGTTHPGTPTP
jgi:hypothetical protein